MPSCTRREQIALEKPLLAQTSSAWIIDLGHSKKVLKSAFFLGIGQVIIKFIDLIAMIVMARFLMPEDFGIAALAVTALTISRSVTQLQVGQALVRKEVLEDNDLDRAFTIAMLRGCVIALLLIALSFPMEHIYGDPRVGDVVRLIALAPFLEGFKSPAMVLFSRDINYLPQTKVQAGGKVASFITSVILAILFKSFWAIVAGHVSIALFGLIYTYILAPYRPRLKLKGSAEIFHFAGWITVSQMIGALNVQGDKLFLGAILGPTNLGFYAVAQNISDTLGHGLAAPLLNPIFSSLSRMQDDLERLERALLRGQQYLAALLFPLGAGLGAMSAPVIAVVMGPNWANITPLLLWLAPSAAFQTLSVPTQAVVYATGRTKLWAIRAGILLIIRFIPVILAAYWGGLMPAVITHVLTGIAIVFMNFKLTQQTIGVSVRRQIMNIWRIFLGSILTFLAFYFYQASIPLPDGIFGRIGYFALSAVLGATVYVTTLFSLWRFEGQPSTSIEHEVWSKLSMRLR